MDKVERAVDDIRRKWVPDPRLGVFDVVVTPPGGAQHATPLLTGATSSRDAQDALRRLAGEQDLAEEVRMTVIHELAHHLGIDDDRLHDLGVD